MRIATIVLAVAIAAPAPAAGPAPAGSTGQPVRMPPTQPYAETRDCPRTTGHVAGSGSAYQGAPLAPRKLTELPPATAYMAVHRTIEGCEVPLTMSEYRTGRRP